MGEGTYDPVTKKPIKPLLLVTLPDLSIDFYAMIDDRQVRLFTLTADISLPLSLIFEGCDKVTPALGDLQLPHHQHPHRQQRDARRGSAGARRPGARGDRPGRARARRRPVGLRAALRWARFKLKVNEVKGLGRITGTEAYNHLGIYATLLPANGMCACLGAPG